MLHLWIICLILPCQIWIAMLILPKITWIKWLILLWSLRITILILPVALWIRRLILPGIKELILPCRFLPLTLHSHLARGCWQVTRTKKFFGDLDRWWCHPARQRLVTHVVPASCQRLLASDTDKEVLWWSGQVVVSSCKTASCQRLLEVRRTVIVISEACQMLWYQLER